MNRGIFAMACLGQNIELFEWSAVKHSPRIHPWEKEEGYSKIFARMVEKVLMAFENWAYQFKQALALPSLVLKQHGGCFKTCPFKGTQVLAKTNNIFIRTKFFPLSRTYLSLERDRNWLAIFQREGSARLGVNAFQAQSSIINQKS